jgi:hypothetical protein
LRTLVTTPSQHLGEQHLRACVCRVAFVEKHPYTSF